VQSKAAEPVLQWRIRNPLEKKGKSQHHGVNQSRNDWAVCHSSVGPDWRQPAEIHTGRNGCVINNRDPISRWNNQTGPKLHIVAVRVKWAQHLILSSSPPSRKICRAQPSGHRTWQCVGFGSGGLKTRVAIKYRVKNLTHVYG
jgi:hypothetical protein